MSKRFLIPVLFHIILALSCCFFIGFASISLLSVYTKQGEGSSVEVPNLVGISIRSLIEQQEDLPILFKVLDSVYIPERRPGEIIKQSPTSTYIDPVDQTIKKRWIKEQKEIGLVINRFRAPIVEIFNYYARPSKEVRILLRELGINVTKEVKINAGVCPDCVVQITDVQGNHINFRDQIREGRQVILFVDATGYKEKKMVNVPLLEGLTITEAQEIIQQAKLNLGNITTIKTSGDYTQQSIIQSQSPNPRQRTQISVGSYINITVRD